LVINGNEPAAVLDAGGFVSAGEHLNLLALIARRIPSLEALRDVAPGKSLTAGLDLLRNPDSQLSGRQRQMHFLVIHNSLCFRRLTFSPVSIPIFAELPLYQPLEFWHSQLVCHSPRHA
jgi:hypothetical protein